MTEEFVRRLTLVKDALAVKGYDNPKLEISGAILGRHGWSVWATIILGDPKNWCERPMNETFEGALEAIEASIPNIPNR